MEDGKCDSVDSVDESELTCCGLNFMTGLGCQDMVKLLLKSDHAKGKCEHDNNPSPLFVLPYIGNKKEELEVAKMLLDYGVDVNAATPDKETPLHRACKRNDVELTKMLIDYGADVEAQDISGKTPLFYCKEDSIAELLLRANAKMDVRDEDDRTALHSVLQDGGTGGTLDVAKRLVMLGADIYAKDKKGKTPIDDLDDASKKEFERIVLSLHELDSHLSGDDEGDPNAEW